MRRFPVVVGMLAALLHSGCGVAWGQQPIRIITSGYESSPVSSTGSTSSYYHTPVPSSYVVPATTQYVVPAPLPGSTVVPAMATSSIRPSVIPASAARSLATSVHSASTASRLRTLMQQAKGELSADRIPKLDIARRELDAALRQLEQFIAPETENGKRWSRFLQLDDLAEELDRERPQVAALSELEMNMRQNYVGLEYPQFVRLRDRLGDYIRAAKYGASPERTIEFLEGKIDDAIESLDEPADDSGLELLGTIGLLVDYLAEAEQSPQLVSQLRGAYNYPNLQITVQESFVNRLVGRSVAEPSPVSECILGTRILGNACLSGNLSADLLPMSNGVSLRLNMNAMLTSQNQGFNRGVVINTSGQSPVLASKVVYITPNGISSSVATASTNLQTRINSIQHKRRIVRRIASKKAAQQKPQADAIAEGRMQQRIQSQYDAQVNQQLAEANANFAKLTSFSPPELQRIGLSRPNLNFYSTDVGVQANVDQAAATQLSAAGPSLIPRPASSQIVVEAHQSAIINTLDVVLGGRRIRSENLDEYAQQISGKVSPEIKKEAAGEAWSILFANFHPIQLEFDDNAIKIVLRISQMTREDQVLPESATVSATYVPSFRNGTITLDRQGPVDIQFAETRGMRVLTLRTFMEGKFEATFKEQLVIDGVNLANRFPNAPKLIVDSWTLDNGWLQVGLR